MYAITTVECLGDAKVLDDQIIKITRNKSIHTLGVYDKNSFWSAKHREPQGIFQKEPPCVTNVVSVGSATSVSAVADPSSQAVMCQQHAKYNIS